MPESIFDHIRRERDDEFFDDSQLAAPVPTDAPPGTPERVEVYARRLERGEHLSTDGDRFDWAGIRGVFDIHSKSGPKPKWS